MCGRAVVINKEGMDQVEQEFHLKFNPYALNPWVLRYNIRPTQDLPVIRRGDDDQLELVELHWWLIPSWSKEPSSKWPTFNARSEGIESKPSWRAPFKKRRCIVVVDGFYEWPKKPNTDHRPRFIRYADGRPMLLAGLWDRWKDPVTGVSVDSCAIVTTAANALLETVPHDRSPVILDVDAAHEWLETPSASAKDLIRLLVPHEADDLVMAVASQRHVNHGWSGPECLTPDVDP